MRSATTPPPPATDSSEALPAVSRLPARTLYGWGVGGFAEYAMVGMLSGLIMPIFNTGFGLDAVMVSWAITLPRLLDAFTDPIMGNLSDNTHTRWGRRRPYILVGAILCAFMLMAVWWASPSWSQQAQFTWLLVVSCLFTLAYTVYSIPLMALGFELTDDYQERTRISAVRTFFCTLPGLMFSWTYWATLRPAFGGEIYGIRWISALVALIVITTGTLPFFLCRERFQRANPVRVPLLPAIKQTLRNSVFLRLLAFRLAMALGLGLFNGLLFYVSVYTVCGGDKAFATKIGGFGGMLYTVFTFLLIPLTPKISRSLGKRTGLLIGLGGILLSAIVQPFILNPDYPWLMLLQPVIGAPVVTMAMVFTFAFLPDIADLDDAATGLRREGLYGSVDKFFSKIESAAVVLATGYLIKFSGFDQALTTQPESVQTSLRWLSFTPFILFSALALAVAWTFPIREKLMTEVRDFLAARRNGRPLPELSPEARRIVGAQRSLTGQ